MNDRSSQAAIFLSIAAVERDTGLSKDTLRVWERRYGFPQPSRDVYGERAYPLEQVDRLRVIRRLLDAGHRPGKIIRLQAAELHSLCYEIAGAPRSLDEANCEQEVLDRFIQLVKEHRILELRDALFQSLSRLGVARFVRDVVAPLNTLVGESWARGYLEVFEEHLYTESLQIVLRNAISNIPTNAARPRVLLTTFPNETHGIGLLMAEAILALEGCACISLGVQTPMRDIVLAAIRQDVDIVALSFSPSLNPNYVLDGLVELRAKLPATIALWAGGQCPILQRKPPRDVVVVGDLSTIQATLDAWRQSR